MVNASHEVLKEKLDETRRQIPEGFYGHSKSGQYYQVLGHVILEGTTTPMVRYQDMIEMGVEYIRPAEQWYQEIETDAGDIVPRFVNMNGRAITPGVPPELVQE